MRRLKREVSAVRPHLATSQKPQQVGTRRSKLHLYAMSVRELDSSRDSVQHGSIGKRTPLIRLEKGTRANVRNIHALRAKSPHSEQEGSAKRKPRVRETQERCKGRQLLSPQRP